MLTMMVSEKTLHEDIIEKAWTDEHFRQQLHSNPKQALREAFGIVIPEHIQVLLLRSSKMTMCLSYLPILPK
jgi:hypothetical protein